MLVNSLLKNVLVLLLGCCFFSSCIKKIDNVSPQIIIESPLPNSNFILPKTINVKGFSEDDNKLKKIEIYIANKNLTPISSKVSIEVDSKIFDFDESFYLDDPLIESESYFVSIKAFDEHNNVNSKYINISLTEIKRVFKGIYFVNNQNENSDVHFIDSNDNVSFVSSLIGNTQLSYLNSKHQYLFIATDQNAFSYTTPHFDEIWSFFPYLTPYPFFSNLTCDVNDDYLYIVLGDGRINAYNKYGQIVNTIYANEQEWFGSIYTDNNIVLSEVFSNSFTRYIAAYFINSGVENQRLQINGKVAKILKKQDDLFIIAINNQNNGGIFLYDLNNNNIWLEIEISNSEIYDALIADELLYIATNLGVYTYEFSTNSLNLDIDIKPIYELNRDHLDGNFLFNDGKNIYRYIYGDSPTTIYSSVDSISNIMLFYNK